ncbi:pentapeptide repeat-containing protein [Shimia sp. R9_1]|uniref:pentapeptide repeat-containing protein n=1 Tax=Shimia sp. R9_1 TaxID=2821111 RepID=UPI001ADAAB9E|nr:pentapeptide repeat-containing protein [Shimia sp. R9_1]MBO9405843.1 pentapeptide repeat-containing protein [Shimia sp. R9_1]
MEEMTLPISEQMFWGIAFSGGFAALTLLIFAILSPPANRTTSPLEKIMHGLGLEKLNPGVFLLLATLWLGIFLLLTSGLFGLIWDVIWHEIPNRKKQTEIWDWRFKLVQLTALTTVLGAVVILPVTLQRLRLNKEQTETATAGLFNEKIAEAAADLHAQRQISKKTGTRSWETLWEEDIVRRNAAIDRLEGLVREEPREATRVSRLLSVYVRELSKIHTAPESPETDDIDRIKAWVGSLTIERSDMEFAVQVLGRLQSIENVQTKNLEIDLRKANLGAMELTQLNFENGIFRDASLQGVDFGGANLRGINLGGANLQEAIMWDTDLRNAYLGGAKLRGAILREANLKETYLEGADLQRVYLGRADLEGAIAWGADFREATLWDATLLRANLEGANLISANLREARLTGANLSSAVVDGTTNLIDACFKGASFKFVDLTMVPKIEEHLNDIFGDGSTLLPNDIARPRHWPREELDLSTYHSKWRAFAASKGVDIPD